MGQVLIRQLDDDIIADYRDSAQRYGRSLEAELRALLIQMRPRSSAAIAAAKERAAAIRAMTPNVLQTDSTLLIRQDRDGHRDV